MIVSGVSAAILQMEEDWASVARDRGLVNPLRMRIDRFRQEEIMFDGKPIRVFKTDYNDYSQEEYNEACDLWYSQKNEYIAERLFNEISYEAFVNYAAGKPYVAWMLTDRRFRACQAQGAQCNLFCEDYGKESCFD